MTEIVPDPQNPIDYAQALVLLVDDEPHVLSSLNRALRRNFRILTAPDGKHALELLEQHPVDVVISDSRMPGMDGPTLLAEVRARRPECIRILLTGFVDVDDAIRAINQGQINRYLSKPWDDSELIMVIRQTLERQFLYRERIRLLALTQEQNAQLQAMNANLEQRVRERTAELLETTQQLEIANNELKQAYVTATEVFSSLINLRLPPSRQTNRQVIDLATGFARFKNADPAFVQDLAMAAALYNLGKLTWEDAMIALPPASLTGDQHRRYRLYPQVGEQLLIPLQPVHEAAVMVRHHQERWDGKGFPDQLVGQMIPLGSRMLKLVIDYIETQMGMVLVRKIPKSDVLKNLPNYAGSVYDPTLCTEFLAFIEAFEARQQGLDEGVERLAGNQLEPGMVIALDLLTETGTLLLKRGTVLNERLIERLLDFEARELVSHTFHVTIPGATLS